MKQSLFRISILLLIALLILAGFNVLTDPFGVFGDPIMHRKGYSVTQNPAIAEIDYLDSAYEEYDSYIIGNLGCNLLDIDAFDRFYDEDFYSIGMNRPDLADCEKTAAYVLEHYGAKHIVICLSVDSLCFKKGLRPVSEMLPKQVSGSSPISFYGRLLLSNPRYGFNKCKSYYYSRAFFDVMEPQGYDFFTYIKQYFEPGAAVLFENPASPIEIDAMQSLESVGQIKALCEQYDADFTFVLTPMYAEALDVYVGDELLKFLNELADITDYWNFCGYHEAAFEPRWFSSISVPCEDIMKKISAVICREEIEGIPENLGTYVTRENAVSMECVNRLSASAAEALSVTHDADVPILMYHHISDDFQSSVTATTEQFRSHMEALYNAGYTAVSFHDLVCFVDTGKPLPEKPIVITFDDGYSSNLEIAAPILAQYGYCAEVAVIGENLGLETEALRFFTLDEALSWINDGIIEIGAHSWGLHHTEPRQGIYQMANESDADYIALLQSDTDAITSALTDAYGEVPLVYAYPYGYNNPFSEIIISRAGYRVTLGVEPGMNTVIRGLPQTLHVMKRLNVPDTMTASDLLSALDNLK